MGISSRSRKLLTIYTSAIILALVAVVAFVVSGATRPTQSLLLGAAELISGARVRGFRQSLPELQEAEALYAEALARGDLDEGDRRTARINLVVAIAVQGQSRLEGSLDSLAIPVFQDYGLRAVEPVIRELSNLDEPERIERVLGAWQLHCGDKVKAEAEYMLTKYSARSRR